VVDIYDMVTHHFCGYRGVRGLTIGSNRLVVAVTACDRRGTAAAAATAAAGVVVAAQMPLRIPR